MSATLRRDGRLLPLGFLAMAPTSESLWNYCIAERKHFFFEKKEAKNFCQSGLAPSGKAEAEQ
jgi:hypothetical protein